MLKEGFLLYCKAVKNVSFLYHNREFVTRFREILMSGSHTKAYELFDDIQHVLLKFEITSHTVIFQNIAQFLQAYFLR